MHVCMDEWMDGWMYVWMHACMHACMYVVSKTMGRFQHYDRQWTWGWPSGLLWEQARPCKKFICSTFRPCTIINMHCSWFIHGSGPGSLLLLAPPCSSWTRVSRGTTMRTKMNPMGLSYPFVIDGNLTMSRLLARSHVVWFPFLNFEIFAKDKQWLIWCVLVTCSWGLSEKSRMPRLALLILLAEAVFCAWVLEQPHGSVDTVPYHPRISWVCNEVLYDPCLH